MSYMYLSSCICYFHELGEELDYSRESIIPMTLTLRCVMKTREVVGHVPQKHFQAF